MLDDPLTRAKIVAEARSWVGTPYVHCADIKHVGCDCGMLLVRIFCDLDLVAPFDPRPYSPDWALHRDDERYLQILLDRAKPVAKPSPGDMFLIKVGRCYSHGGIVTQSEPLRVVHASFPDRYVLEEELWRNSDYAAKLSTAKYFSLITD